MAVIFYGEGEHPAGFIGYRVATTLGHASAFRQQYFSLEQYGEITARTMAHRLDARWRAEAMAERRKRQLSGPRLRGGAGALITGLSARFIVDSSRQAHSRARIRPVFVSQIPGYGRGQKTFSILALGYDSAFEQAVEHYVAMHDLSGQERQQVLKVKPRRELFIHTLRMGLFNRGIIYTAAEVRAMVR